MSEFDKKLAQLQADLNTQGDRVVEQLFNAVEACFGCNEEVAQSVLDGESTIDRVDVEIERACIGLLRLRFFGRNWYTFSFDNSKSKQ